MGAPPRSPACPAPPQISERPHEKDPCMPTFYHTIGAMVWEITTYIGESSGEDKYRETCIKLWEHRRAPLPARRHPRPERKTSERLECLAPSRVMYRTPPLYCTATYWTSLGLLRPLYVVCCIAPLLHCSFRRYVPSARRRKAGEEEEEEDVRR